MTSLEPLPGAHELVGVMTDDELELIVDHLGAGATLYTYARDEQRRRARPRKE